MVVGGRGRADFSVLWWLPFVRGITRAVSRPTRPKRIAEGRFDARAPERRRDELERIGRRHQSHGRTAGRFVAGQNGFLAMSRMNCARPRAAASGAGDFGTTRRHGAPADLEDLREEVEEMGQLVNW